jgi:hypothetical protein
LRGALQMAYPYNIIFRFLQVENRRVAGYSQKEKYGDIKTEEGYVSSETDGKQFFQEFVSYKLPA